MEEGRVPAVAAHLQPHARQTAERQEWHRSPDLFDTEVGKPAVISEDTGK